MKFSFALLLLIISCGNVFPNPSCPELKPNMINVHLVCHTHDDVGWLKTVDQYYYGSKKGITWVGVQYVLDSVIPALLKDINKKFIYVESAFFFRWWNEQNDQMKDDVKKVVSNGQLEFINGGWCMNDEATTHYNDIIDQMTIGVQRLNDTFGPVSFPRIGWQIDPFGHSSEQASLFAQMGMDGLFFARLDHDDKSNRWDTKSMEMIWKSSKSLAEDAWIFTGALPNHYSPPAGFCFDILCGDDPIMDDPNLDDYNKDDMVDKFINAVNDQAEGFLSQHNLIMTMGEDFNYVYADAWYKNLDKLIKYVNERQETGTNINLVYSTPSCYVDALHSENLTWPTKTDDFFPYASDPHAYWTGYFTSRPTLKGYVRQSNNLLQAIKQIAALSGIERGPDITTLADAVGVLQHHDAVAGTAKQHVTDDYSKRLARGAAVASDLIASAFNTLTLQELSENFTTCSLLNISSCAYTEENLSFVVNVYNPIGRTRSHYVRVPVPDAFDYSVVDQQGNFLEIQLVPIPTPVLNIPGRESTAQYDLIFYAENLQPLGMSQFIVQSSGSSATQNFDIVNNKMNTKSRDNIIEKGKVTLTFDDSTNKLKTVGIKSEDGLRELNKVTLTFDDSTNKLKTVGIKIEDGLRELNVAQDWMYYVGMEGDNNGADNRASGAYVFRPDGEATTISDVVTITAEYNGTHVYEVHQEWSPWVTQVVRTYTEKSYVEIEWLIGPIPVDDDIGKEIVNRINWGMATDQTFYTDANGREMQKRVKDFRETWDLSTTTEPVSRNYYPVTSRMILYSTDGQGNAAILNDRAQGGTSLSEGETELMVHRRLLHDDAFGVGEALNEQQFGDGLVARGRHILIHSNMSTTECDFGCQHRTVGEELLLQPLLTFSDTTTFRVAQAPGLLAPLPSTLRVLTLEPWTNPGTWLLRLENYFEEGESSLSGTVQFDIEDIFTDWTVTDIQEVTLAANAFVGDIVRLQWDTLPDEKTKKAPAKPKSGAAVYSFSPMQIRSFILGVVHK